MDRVLDISYKHSCTWRCALNPTTIILPKILSIMYACHPVYWMQISPVL